MGSLKGGAPAVRARGLGLRYPGGRVGLEGLELEVSRGEVVALLGPNGSGKSTLLRLLATDLRPTSGSLQLLGMPSDPPGTALRRRIGYAADEPVHLDFLSGTENLRLFLSLAAGGGGASPEPEALLEAFALTGVMGTPVSEYSFGMRRKLLLAEALAPRPELLLLDEPSVGLDPDGSRALGETLRRRADGGTAVVLATNEVRETPFWADRVLFLHQGRVLEDSAPEALRARVQGRTLIQVDLGWGGFPTEAREGLRGLEGVDSWRIHGESPGDPSPGSPVSAASPGSTESPGFPASPEEASGTPPLPPGQGGSLRLEVETRSGGRILPALLQQLMESGAGIREVRVREPDLGDLFRELTGVSLGGERVRGEGVDR